MSIIRKAFEQRSVSTFGGLGAWVTSGRVDIPAGYGVTGGTTPGAGAWLPGMQWQSFGTGGGAQTPDDAMRLSAVYACLRLLTEAISTLPMDTFKRFQGARRTYRPRPDYLSFEQPGISRILYLTQVMMSLLTDGNAFIATPRDDLGVPLALVPIDPNRVSVGRRADGTIEFTVDQKTYDEYDIMHISGLVLPGDVRGVSPLRAARDVVDGGRKAQDYGSTFLNNSAMPPAIIEIPDDSSGDAQGRARRIAQTWQETHGGTANAGKVGVLIGGAKLTTIAVSPQDAQWLDSKRFGVSEIARFYGVPPHLIADASNSTSWGSGLAEQNLAFGQFSLRPWIERIEEAHGRLLTSHGLPDVFVKLNLDALLRASLADRYASYAVGIDKQFLVVNDVRKLEDLPPVPWGDEPFVPHKVTEKGDAPPDELNPPPPATPGGAQ